MRFSFCLAAGIAAALLTACGPGNRAGTGTVVGAVAGGIIGNQVGKGSGQVAATAIGAVVGGIVGHEIGKSMDEADRRAAMEAEYRALETAQSGSQTPWRNPDSGHYGYVVPSQPYKYNNLDCRNYTHTIYISGQPQTMRGKACRQPDGTWRNVG
jgi:surface antigen